MSIHPVGPANLTHTQIPPPGFPSQIPNFQRNFRKPSIPQTIKFPKEFPEIYTRAKPPLQSSPYKWSMRSSSVCRRTATTGTRGSSATQLPFLCGLAAFGGGGAFLPEPPPFGLPAAGDRDFGLACRRGDDLVGVWLGSSRAGAFADRRGISVGKKGRDETRLVARERFCETGRGDC